MTAGVVVTLPERLSAEIESIRAQYDPLLASVPPHVTLVSLIPVSSQGFGWDRVIDHVRDVASRHAPFEASLEGSGTFLPISPVSFLTVDRGRQQFTELAEDLRSGPLNFDALFPYIPHVTIAHSGEEELFLRVVKDLKGFNAEFSVTTMGLYQQDSQGQWMHREEFPLGGGHIHERFGDTRSG